VHLLFLDESGQLAERKCPGLIPYSRSTANFSDSGTFRIELVRNPAEQITAFVSLL
jgi:hypothetical protein